MPVILYWKTSFWARGDMLLTWRAQSGNLSIGQSKWFTPCEPSEQMDTRHSSGIGRLMKPRYNLDIRKNFFTVRAVDPWNSLPSAVKTSPTINKFKEGYDDYYSKRHGSHVWRLTECLLTVRYVYYSAYRRFLTLTLHYYIIIIIITCLNVLVGVEPLRLLY